VVESLGLALLAFITAFGGFSHAVSWFDDLIRPTTFQVKLSNNDNEFQARTHQRLRMSLVFTRLSKKPAATYSITFFLPAAFVATALHDDETDQTFLSYEHSPWDRYPGQIGYAFQPPSAFGRNRVYRFTLELETAKSYKGPQRLTGQIDVSCDAKPRMKEDAHIQVRVSPPT